MNGRLREDAAAALRGLALTAGHFVEESPLPSNGLSSEAEFTAFISPHASSAKPESVQTKCASWIRAQGYSSAGAPVPKRQG